jgi:hypothetical protein
MLLAGFMQRILFSLRLRLLIEECWSVNKVDMPV